jgi:hypothetical protein
MPWSPEQIVRGRGEPAGGSGRDPVDPQVTTAPRLHKGVVGAGTGHQLGYQQASILKPRQRSVDAAAKQDLPQGCAADQHRPRHMDVLRGQVDLRQMDGGTAIANG